MKLCDLLNLHFVEFIIMSFSFDEFFVNSFLHIHSLLDDNDFVSVINSRQSMRDH